MFDEIHLHGIYPESGKKLSYVPGNRSTCLPVLDISPGTREEMTCSTLYCPTDAHNVKNVELLKYFKMKEAARTCFSLQGNHHQGPQPVLS